MNKIFQLFYAIAILFSLTSCVREDNTPVKVPPIEGAVIEPNIGGAAETNQVWVELATGNMKSTHREDWDLGFYSGDEFRVILNSSLTMAVGKIENVTNIDEVTPAMVAELKTKVQVADFTDNASYIDDPSGNFLTQTTGIDAINEDDNLNNVYLLNMGRHTYTGTTSPGTAYSVGEERGWKKIRILQTNGGYKIQFADLEETTHHEMIIIKNADYNFNFFSIVNGTTPEVQPKKKNWDLCFTVFTNLTLLDATNNIYTSYIFPDSVLSNLSGGVGVYEVITAAGQGETGYNNFKSSDVDASKFIFKDQRTIGSNWRTTTGSNGAEVYSNKFYILKDTNGFIYKLRFMRMKDDNGFRGHPQFEYKPL